jgi:pSer/pThr/pTyr-binding forkhead associated (FHA) protein
MADPLPVLTLLVEKGPRKGQTQQHRAGKVNDLAVGDAGVSQHHLDLTFLPPPASWWAAISHGDRIKIGESTVLAIFIAADAGPEPAATRRSTRLRRPMWWRTKPQQLGAVGGRPRRCRIPTKQ